METTRCGLLGLLVLSRVESDNRLAIEPAQTPLRCLEEQRVLHMDPFIKHSRVWLMLHVPVKKFIKKLFSLRLVFCKLNEISL